MRAGAATDTVATDMEYTRAIRSALQCGTRLLAAPPDGATLNIDGAAREAWLAWRKRIEDRLRPDGDLPDLADWANKIGGGALRLAGLLHMAEHESDLVRAVGKPIVVETMRRALALADYFTTHAVRGRPVLASDLMFPAPHGGAWHSENLRRELRVLLKAARIAEVDDRGRSLDVHALRTTATTRMLRHGVSLPIVMEVIGHRDPALTMAHYCDLRIDTTHDAFGARLDADAAGSKS